MSRAVRVVIAFAVAPLAGPLLFGILFFAVFLAGSNAQTPIVWGLTQARYTFEQSLLKSYEATIFLGGPLYLLFRRLKWDRLLYAIVAGAVVALVPMLFTLDVFGRVTFDGIEPTARGWATELLLFVSAGLATGLIFWIAAFAPPHRGMIADA